CVLCNDPNDDTKCMTVYGAGNLCIAGACAVANCRTAADCGGKPCVGNQCAAACMDDSDCSDAATPVCNTTSGVCVSAASCGATAQGMPCPVNAQDICCGAGTLTCQPVQCCGSGACTYMSVSGTCTGGVCVPSGCTAPSGTTRYVDFASVAPGA